MNSLTTIVTNRTTSCFCGCGELCDLIADYNDTGTAVTANFRAIIIWTTSTSTTTRCCSVSSTSNCGTILFTTTISCTSISITSSICSRICPRTGSRTITTIGRTITTATTKSIRARLGFGSTTPTAASKPSTAWSRTWIPSCLI